MQAVAGFYAKDMLFFFPSLPRTITLRLSKLELNEAHSFFLFNSYFTPAPSEF